MAIKDLFSKQKEQKTAFRGAHQESLDEFRGSVESTNEIKEVRREDNFIVPDLNYASASNFAKFGSAEKYYADAIKRIYTQYPYDGSNAEKLKFKNDLTQLERHVLDNQYPRSTGFITIAADGWGTRASVAGDWGEPNTKEYIQLYSQVAGTLYDTESNHRGNLHLNWYSGSCIEFWMKKNAFPGPSLTSNEAIFQISGGVGQSGHQLTLFVDDGPTNAKRFGLDYYTTTNGFSSATIKFQANIDLTKITTFADSTWRHYAIDFQQTSATALRITAYVDGAFDNEQVVSVSAMPTGISGSLMGTLGATGAKISSISMLGGGKLSGSLDEFRFWRKTRTAQEVGRNYFTVINGGITTDTVKYDDDHPVDLGVYFKFNEGITGRTSTDSIVLDYGGGLSNGAWTGYSSTGRSTESAITLAGVGTEKGDPIIYSYHPDVETLSTNLEGSGSIYDAGNMGNLQNSIPLWMLDEDTESGGELKNLLQIIGSYLDSLYLQISQISKFQNADYQDNTTAAANPYNNRLLTSLGFDIPEFFIDKTVLETIVNQDDKRKFEDKLNEIKNLIYKNIYNNLTYINKSKGTVKSIRNLLRCYGVDDDLFNFNVYADNADFFLEDDYKNSSVKFDSLDMTPFANVENSEAVIYNFSETGNNNSSPYLSGSGNGNTGFTVEANVLFPKTPSTYQDSVDLTRPAIVTASVFGTRQANDTTTTTVDNNNAEMTVYVVKDDNAAKFQLTSSLGVFIESDKFYDVYDNSQWNLSIRIKPTEYPFNSEVTGASGYTVEFAGYNYIQDILHNSFDDSVSLSVADGNAFFSNDKRVYAGAERTNITGTLQARSNMKLLSVLAWQNYLESAELSAHARDVTSYGRRRPYKNSFVFQGTAVSDVYIPQTDTLAMYWAFNQITSSDATGEIVVPDLDSGSLGLVAKYGDYSKIADIQNTAQGSRFAESADVKEIQYLNVSTQQIPENLNTDNMIQILASDDDLFFVNSRPVRYFFSMEASMYDTISREMLKTFAGVLDYASMIGSPIVEHQTENKELRIAREVFFSKVENTPDLQKYISLYKFLDSAIESVLFQLIPASADMSDRVRTVIESHIFERAHRRKHLIPDAKAVTKDGAGGHGGPVGKHHNKTFTPAGDDQKGNLPPPTNTPCCNEGDWDCLSTDPTFPLCKKTKNNAYVDSVSIQNDADINVNKGDFNGGAKFYISTQQQADEKLKQFLNSYNNKRFTDASNSNGYNGWYRTFASPEEAGLSAPTDGDNKTRNSVFYSFKNKKLEEIGKAAKVSAVVVTKVDTSNAKPIQHGNIILPIIQDEEATNLLSLQKNEEQTVVADDLVKNFVNYDVTITEATGDKGSLKLKKTQLPIQFRTNGAGQWFDTSSGSVVGHHRDVYYGNLETPIQGPFPETHVGGYKNRHHPVGQTSDRPELFKLYIEDSTTVQLYNPRIEDPGGTPTYNSTLPRVKFSREEMVKRVYNIKNIKDGTVHDFLGNFSSNYEVVMTNGRKYNNLAFVQQNGFTVTGSESTIVSGVLDFPLPTRTLSDGTNTKTVIVNRFASPGSVATMAEGYLDADSGEYSPYNALPYRNLEVRGNLDTFWKTPSAFGGYESGSTVTASFLNIPRNGVKQLKYNNVGTLYTASLWDNGFATHGIPNRDFGYSWIADSADPLTNEDGNFGFATSSNGLYGITFYPYAERGNSENEVINFAHYSTPTSKIGSAGYHYEITADNNLVVAPTAYTDGTWPSSASIYFLNLNGPYQFPTWKQARGGQHPVARYLRENNYVLAETEEENNRRVQQAPVSSKHAPILHNIRSQEVIGEELLSKDVLLTYTFGNNYEFYGNYYDSNTSRLANPFSRNYDTSYKQNSLLYGVSELYTGKRKSISLNSLYWNETIWPKDCNTYRSIARDRTTFSFNWKDSLSNRVDQITGSQASTAYSMWPMDTNGTQFGELLNCNNEGASLSVRFGRYHLTVPGHNAFRILTASAPQNTAQFGTADSAGYGPFSNSYTDWNKELRLIAKDQSIVPEYRISEHVGSLIDAGYDLTNATYQSLSLTGSAETTDNNTFLERYVHSDDIPSIEIIRGTQGKDADRISLTATVVKKLLPYEGFYPVERTKQLSTLFSQSVAPNTTLTGTQASFQTLNNTIYSRLSYGSIRAGIATDTAIWESGSLAANETTYASCSIAITNTTNCYSTAGGTNAWITLSASHLGGAPGDYVENYHFDTTYAAGDGSATDPFIIFGDSADSDTTTAANVASVINASSSWFTAISDGVSVTASAVVANEGGDSEEMWVDLEHFTGPSAATPAITGSYFIEIGTSHELGWRKKFTGYAAGLTNYNPTGSWSRLPFETIVSPAAYLNATSSLIENDPENPFDSSASVGAINQKYELAASNFYAGVVDSFIEGSNLTTIQSAPESEWTFDGSNNVYSMDIVITKDRDFSNHDDPAANGAPYTAHASFYQPLSASSGEWWSKHITEGSSSVTADIPPNASWSENEAYVRIDFDYSQFKSVVTDREPTLNDVLKYSTRTYTNKQMLEQLGSTWATSTASNASQFMTIEAGVDLFNYNGNNNTWQPTTRWECPVHNYVDTTVLLPDGTSGGDGTTAGTANRGVWHQYSSTPSDGLRLLVRGPDTTVSRDSGSLAQACGFETNQKPIGIIASELILKEYLVAVPFVTNECEEETFFHYDINEFERAYAAIGKERVGTMTQTLSKMRDLILPIKFNFMDKRDSTGKRLEQDDYLPILPPFAMYIFEITEELDQASVSKIWQGVLPDAGQKAVFEKFNIDHKIEAGQIISPSTLNNDLFKGKLPKEMRFKIFKAKHRSNLLYPQLKERVNGVEFLQKSVLGYNYPHDFYSLIETAKVNLGLEYYPKQEDEFNFPKLPDDLASSAILDAASTILKSTNNPSSNQNALMLLADEDNE